MLLVFDKGKKAFYYARYATFDFRQEEGVSQIWQVFLAATQLCRELLTDKTSLGWRARRADGASSLHL